MHKIHSICNEYITYKKGRKVMYLILNSGLYGILQGALLWYKLLVSKLQSFRFVLNPRDLCIANTNIDRKQCSIVFYVGDNKISHKDPKVADKVIEMIENEFRKIVVK